MSPSLSFTMLFFILRIASQNVHVHRSKSGTTCHRFLFSAYFNFVKSQSPDAFVGKYLVDVLSLSRQLAVGPCASLFRTVDAKCGFFNWRGAIRRGCGIPTRGRHRYPVPAVPDTTRSQADGMVGKVPRGSDSLPRPDRPEPHFQPRAVLARGDEPRLAGCGGSKLHARHSP